MSSRAKSWFGLAALACVACCAVPIMAALGIGGAAGSLTAAFSGVNLETIACLGILGAMIGGALYFVVRQRSRRKQAASCETYCQTDASCCGGSAKSNT